jgi:protein SCO1/2
MIPRKFLIALMLLAAAAALAGFAAVTFQQRSPYRQARVGGPFTLSDTEGRPVTQADLLGRPTVLFFGFTYCPDVCPTTLFTLTNSLKAMGKTADRLNVVFVTVDPERDNAAQMKLYLESFDPRIRGLTGTPAQVADIVDAYHVHAKRIPTADGGYTMEHSSNIMLFDKDGRLVGGIDYGEDDAAMTAKLNKLAVPGQCRPDAPASLWERSVTQGIAAGYCG